MPENIPDDVLEDLCPEMREYFEWYNREFVAQLRKLAPHVLSCPKCQELTLGGKDQSALQMLQTTDAGFMEKLRELSEDEGGRVESGYEKEKATLIGKIVGFVAVFIESHELTDWCHELPEGGEESIEAYLIPKRESDELRAAMKSFLEDSVRE